MPFGLIVGIYFFEGVVQYLGKLLQAKRQNDLALQPLEIIVARKNLFHDWLDSKGKLGGQHKVPRLSNTREYIEEMLKLNFKE